MKCDDNTNGRLSMWVVMVPAALIMLLTGNIGASVLLLLTALAIGSIDNLLEPFLIGRDAGMHDLLVFFSMVGGIAVFGVTGFIVGPVIAAFFRTLLDIYSVEFNKQLRVLHDSPAVRHPPSQVPESLSPAVSLPHVMAEGAGKGNL
jgi:predicted PurR-regulated permease PerM